MPVSGLYRFEGSANVRKQAYTFLKEESTGALNRQGAAKPLSKKIRMVQDQ